MVVTVARPAKDQSVSAPSLVSSIFCKPRKTEANFFIKHCCSWLLDLNFFITCESFSWILLRSNLGNRLKHEINHSYRMISSGTTHQELAWISSQNAGISLQKIRVRSSTEGMNICDICELVTPLVFSASNTTQQSLYVYLTASNTSEQGQYVYLSASNTTEQGQYVCLSARTLTTRQHVTDNK